MTNDLPEHAMDNLSDLQYSQHWYYLVIFLLMATSLKIDEALRTRVQSLADERHRSAHSLMLEAIQQYVDREEAKESFKQEALASWRAYQLTGKHLTAGEVRSWLDTWGTADEYAAPECHK